MIKVLEIGAFSAGYFGRLFARQEAEVLRIDLASATPAWASPEAMDGFLHTNKRCLALSNPCDIAQYADAADVVVCEANTADELIQLGFEDWETKIKVAITPFGKTGPKRNWQATPSTLLAMGGYTHLMGDANRTPLTLPGHYLEFQSGAIAYAAAVACLHADQADVIDVSMLETVLSLTQFTSVRWHCAGQIRERHGSDFYFVVPSNLFKTLDGGWIYINIVPAFWDAFTVFIDLPELLIDERFENNDLRIENRMLLYQMTADVIATWTTSECVERAEISRIPLGVVQTFAAILSDPHLASRDFWQELELEGETVRLPRGSYHLHSRLSRALTSELPADAAISYGITDS
ncbi:MAG: hypothetical protein HOB98_23240 [Gammaproteobacteria bacterium]|jgi:crotonobetainyl-CoA:carnitine CoA-transferase CaiB-like acyl-CoA transferase|nr:hypothetical protein [Gammaproteobacteria bacterium]MBT6950045.1 hypothetical protein [Gammaproteobacteria bacterium]MBT7176953.1 hypothetical protein [Gammaproteobacteria bacterium]MBT7798440.1 hypothetical protein [Gammaproteobacteria bacterium]